jgi:hypothetical protein
VESSIKWNALRAKGWTGIGAAGGFVLSAKVTLAKSYFELRPSCSWCASPVSLFSRIAAAAEELSIQILWGGHRQRSLGTQKRTLGAVG